MKYYYAKVYYKNYNFVRVEAENEKVLSRRTDFRYR